MVVKVPEVGLLQGREDSRQEHRLLNINNQLFHFKNTKKCIMIYRVPGYPSIQRNSTRNDKAKTREILWSLKYHLWFQIFSTKRSCVFRINCNYCNTKKYLEFMQEGWSNIIINSSSSQQQKSSEENDSWYTWHYTRISREVVLLDKPAVEGNTVTQLILL